jgi:hypothetical protein
LVFSVCNRQERQKASSAEAWRRNKDGETSSLLGMPRDTLEALFLIFYKVINFTLNTTAHSKKEKKKIIFCYDCTFTAGCETVKHLSLGTSRVGKHLTETTMFGGDISLKRLSGAHGVSFYSLER